MDTHVKNVVGELEYDADDFFESLPTKFSQDAAALLERPEIRREFVFRDVSV